MTGTFSSARNCCTTAMCCSMRYCDAESTIPSTCCVTSSERSELRRATSAKLARR
jgi:hypothetical protein